MGTPAPRPDQVASGVDALIARLRDDGVAQGRAEAERIVAEAEARAKSIRDAARAEADTILSDARREARELERAGNEALRVAVRDAVLALKDTLHHRFAAEVGREVGEALNREALLERMIVEIAGRMRDRVAAAEDAEVLLPPEHLDLAALRQDHAELQEGTLTWFAKSVAHEVLRDGVEIRAGASGQRGLVVKLDSGAIRIELDDATIAAIVLDHLQPRFRALLEGVVQ